MRYTECRLQSLTADMLLADMDAGAVDFVDTFDASQQEPAVLPAKVRAHTGAKRKSSLPLQLLLLLLQSRCQQQ